MGRAKRTHDPVTVAMLDLDRFKAINDTYGHQAGDEVLKQMAEILRGTAREIDKIGRYGGEEFIVLLPGTDLDKATVFVERVRRKVAATAFDIGRDEPVRMTTSAGLASYPEAPVRDPESLIRLADEALYAAKAAGRNRVVRYNQIPPGAAGSGDQA